MVYLKHLIQNWLFMPIVYISINLFSLFIHLRTFPLFFHSWHFHRCHFWDYYLCHDYLNSPDYRTVHSANVHISMLAVSRIWWIMIKMNRWSLMLMLKRTKHKVTHPWKVVFWHLNFYRSHKISIPCIGWKTKFSV